MCIRDRDDIARQQLVTVDGDRYTITDKGRKVAQELAYDLPRSVREKEMCIRDSPAHSGHENSFIYQRPAGFWPVGSSSLVEIQPP